MYDSILSFLRAVWEVFNSDENDPVVMGLLFGLLSLLISYVVSFRSSRARLADKQREIDALADDRNYWQEIVLKSKKLPPRKSTKRKK